MRQTKGERSSSSTRGVADAVELIVSGLGLTIKGPKVVSLCQHDRLWQELRSVSCEIAKEHV